MQIKLTSTGGKNACSVAWDPVSKTYYSAIAGNEEFPIDVFDSTGAFRQTIPAGVDLRGLWYNPEFDLLEGNTYEMHDVVSYEISDNGLVADATPQVEMYELPVAEPQATIALNTDEALYVYYDAESNKFVELETIEGEVVREQELSFPDAENLNFTTVVYTGIEKGEYGFLNTEKKQVYLVDASNGSTTATIQLPETAITEDAFNFSFANGKIWLFDADTRTWTAYDIY